MLKRPLLMLVFGAAVLLGPAEDSKNATLICQSQAAAKHSSASTAAPVETVQTRTRSFTVEPNAATPVERGPGYLTPYRDHASLPAGAIYTTSDETA